uniref:S1 motif domain-containing protein n=1 Tax=viral metagenome TaxID=1070528 RepID=A0A6C0KZR5_9ZZZZ
MYKAVFLEERVSLSPNDISKKDGAGDLNELLLNRLKNKIEARCIASGYVKPDSLEVLHRSMGMAENGRFTGNYIFYLKLRCKVFHPETGTPVDCKVLKVNKMGAYVVLDEAMRVLLPRDLHIGNTDFDSLKPDDSVSIQILRSRFQTNDAFISAVGMFVSRSKKAPAVVEEDLGAKLVVAENPIFASPGPVAPEEEEEAEEEEPVAAPVVVVPEPKKRATRASKAVTAAVPAPEPVAAPEPVTKRVTRARK